MGSNLLLLQAMFRFIAGGNYRDHILCQGSDTHRGINHIMIFLQDLSLFCLLLPTLLASLPAQGLEQLHLGICAEDCALPLLQSPHPTSNNCIQDQVRCCAAPGSSLSGPITCIDHSLLITLAQALITSQLTNSCNLLAAFPPQTRAANKCQPIASMVASLL